MNSNLEEILELARSKKSGKNLKIAETSSKTKRQSKQIPAADHAEWQDNEDMHSMGLNMSPGGTVHHGAMKVGHIVAVPGSKSKRYVGVHHPSGATTDAHSNRARAAMALMAFHHYLPHKGESANSPHAGMELSNGDLYAVLALAGKVDKSSLRTSAEGRKKYGKVKYADPTNAKYPIDTEEHVRAAWAYINKPHNASVYPLNGVSLDKVKSRIKKAAKKLGIQIKSDSDDSGSGANA